MKRSERQTLAEQTVIISHEGRYKLADGVVVEIGPQVAHCLEATRYFTPQDLTGIRCRVLGQPAKFSATRVEVHAETTLAGARRLLAERPNEAIAALNFASAKNPGGGFLNGSEAQEESLARSSALYATQLRAQVFYDHHRGLKSCLYSDAMILSPDCPVFRDDAGNLLAVPYAVSFITSCAPNAGALKPHEVDTLPEVMRQRAELVLALAAGHGYSALVLGAWGCGVFRNDPEMVARIFKNLLDGDWKGRFERIVFAVYDRTPEQGAISSFRAVLGE